ncbi:ABC transporter permease subunit [Paraburkholderia sp. Se-20369]|nr:ABC transporter permease subunit [Paraburkholderia sp. Se-20369]
MQTQTHPLISPALGTERQITSFHYGPRGGQKIYIQSSLHADELPGMLVATLLRRKIAALESAGKLRGEIVIVPVPNPIGLAQHVFGDHLGRFELGSMQNFNRNFYDLAALVLPRVESRLTGDAQRNVAVVRAAMREALDEQAPRTELESQRLALQKLSHDADIVLDLHCDNDAVMHLYTNPDLWNDVEPLARYLDSQASLLALNSVGNPFDEIHSFCWSDLRARFGDRFPIPNGAISVTVELRSERDVSYDFAEKDAQAIVEYLTGRGVIDGTPAPLPPLAYLPLVVIWFGIDETAKLVVIFLACFAPVAMAARAGVRAATVEQINAAYSLGGSFAQIVRHVVLPAALPEILTGLRIAIGFGWTTLVAAEMVAATAGLGQMVLNASSFLRTDLVVMGILIIGAIAWLFDLAMRWVERRVVPWKGRG